MQKVMRLDMETRVITGDRVITEKEETSERAM